MKPRILAACLALITHAPAAEQRLDVELRPLHAGRDLRYDTLALDAADGRTLSVTRCDLLLSGAALRREDGTWVGPGNWSAYISGRAGRTRFSLTGVPAGRYAGLRFTVGLPEDINLGDPARWPADHPLNPSVNGMHWGWQGGYVFAAIEGLWKAPGAPVGGYSLHLAHSENLAVVELPLTLDLSRDQTLRISLDLATAMEGITLTPESSATHSRGGDPLAAALRAGLSRAFRPEGVSPTPTRAQAARQAKAIISPTATPFRFTYPASFPPPSLPADNPITDEGVALGARLFHDHRLSGNGRQACVTCHRPPAGLSDRRRFSIGAFGDMGERQSMPLTNLAWKSSFFWDGRAPTLRRQVLMPIEDKAEMHASLPDVVRLLQEDPEYREKFDAAFGSRKIDEDRIARALEQFLLTLVADDSKFDRVMKGTEEFDEKEALGFRLFNTEYDPALGQRGADCFHCHGGPLFRSTTFANNGLDGPSPTDEGLGRTTGLAGDRGKFSVPSLRNVGLTAPYMHDGRFDTLEEVVEHYDHGLKRSPTLDPNLAKHPDGGLRLTADEKAALVAFMETLTSGRPPRSLAAGAPGPGRFRPPGPPR